jgi:hypothetical protein
MQATQAALKRQCLEFRWTCCGYARLLDTLCADGDDERLAEDGGAWRRAKRGETRGELDMLESLSRAAIGWSC